jgi:hypothetical protein
VLASSGDVWVRFAGGSGDCFSRRGSGYQLLNEVTECSISRGRVTNQLACSAAAYSNNALSPYAHISGDTVKCRPQGLAILQTTRKHKYLYHVISSGLRQIPKKKANTAKRLEPYLHRNHHIIQLHQKPKKNAVTSQPF